VEGGISWRGQGCFIVILAFRDAEGNRSLWRYGHQNVFPGSPMDRSTDQKQAPWNVKSKTDNTYRTCYLISLLAS